MMERHPLTSSGTLIAAITGLATGKTVSTLWPNDGRLVLDSTRRQVLVGATIASAGTIAAVPTTSSGRTLNTTITVTGGGGVSALLQPILLLVSPPTQQLVDVDVLFDQSVKMGDGYIYQIATDAAFTSPIVNLTGTFGAVSVGQQLSLVTGSIPRGHYFARVRHKRGLLQSPWSSAPLTLSDGTIIAAGPLQFDIIATAAPAGVLGSSYNGSTSVDDPSVVSAVAGPVLRLRNAAGHAYSLMSVHITRKTAGQSCPYFFTRTAATGNPTLSAYVATDRFVNSNDVPHLVDTSANSSFSGTFTTPASDFYFCLLLSTNDYSASSDFSALSVAGFKFP